MCNLQAHNIFVMASNNSECQVNNESRIQRDFEKLEASSSEIESLESTSSHASNSKSNDRSEDSNFDPEGNLVTPKLKKKFSDINNMVIGERSPSKSESSFENVQIDASQFSEKSSSIVLDEKNRYPGEKFIKTHNTDLCKSKKKLDYQIESRTSSSLRSSIDESIIELVSQTLTEQTIQKAKNESSNDSFDDIKNLLLMKREKSCNDLLKSNSEITSEDFNFKHSEEEILIKVLPTESISMRDQEENTNNPQSTDIKIYGPISMISHSSEESSDILSKDNSSCSIYSYNTAQHLLSGPNKNFFLHSDDSESDVKDLEILPSKRLGSRESNKNLHYSNDDNDLESIKFSSVQDDESVILNGRMGRAATLEFKINAQSINGTNSDDLTPFEYSMCCLRCCYQDQTHKAYNDDLSYKY